MLGKQNRDEDLLPTHVKNELLLGQCHESGASLAQLVGKKQRGTKLNRRPQTCHIETPNSVRKPCGKTQESRRKDAKQFGDRPLRVGEYA